MNDTVKINFMGHCKNLGGAVVMVEDFKLCTYEANFPTHSY